MIRRIGMIDFKKLGNRSSIVQLEPRDIFMSLPSRNELYKYPRDVQSEVWKQWFEKRDNKNCIIKMNTGSGKTVVGLIILKSCLNEGKGPAVYVVPDNYLIQQVCSEANRLGIKVTNDEADIDYLRKEAILVINIQKLVNGKSVFGMRLGNNVDIGSIVIDDVHACMAKVENQYTVSIPVSNPLYKSLLELFENSLKAQSENKYLDIADNNDPFASMLVPFWEWQKKAREIYTILTSNQESIEFNFPLIKDCLTLCNCVVSAKCIEITPKCIPIHKISNFVRAERRIFMSATLADDSVFCTDLGLNSSELSTIISPEKANDIGDRLIIFPQVMNKQITDDAIKIKIKEMSIKHNVVIIVPSYNRAKYWRDIEDMELNKDNLDQGVERLKHEHVGVTVLINKYDGIDLPDDACRVLVIDGLPSMRSEFDCFEQNANPNNQRLRREQIQKIEQGMGRGVRSNTDYCVVVLLGKGLADIIYGSDGYSYFSEATRQQFRLSEDLWKQLTKPTVDDVMGLAEYSLSRNIDWITVSKETLSSVRYSTEPHVNNTLLAIRNAFDVAESGRYREAADILTKEKDNITDKELKGLLKQYTAEYTNFYNPEEAQQILLSASLDNRMIIKPIQGIQFTKVLNRTGAQAQFFIDYMTQNGITSNKYILRVNSILEKLTFEEDAAKVFEAALKDISFLLGIYSNRPEDEYGKGPDNFWDIGTSKFLVIECKNGTITDTICKHDCNQLNGSLNWFEALYRSNSCTCVPIMIHNSNVFEYACSPNASIRIMTPDLLEKFKTNVEQFAINVTQVDSFTNIVKINQLLSQFRLLGGQFVDAFTTRFHVKTR